MTGGGGSGGGVSFGMKDGDFLNPNETVKKLNYSQNPNNFEGTCPLSLREIVAYTLF